MEEAAPVRSRRGVILALCLLCGCNAIYEIDETDLSQPGSDDVDGDGLPNLADNCPGDPNQLQSDDDDDGLGDVCDNCPLVANTRQGDGDGDDTGDLCDSHPITPGDCLVVYDSLGDADAVAFASHWEVVPPERASGVEHGSDRLRIASPDDNSFIALRARDLGEGRFDVQAAWHTTLAMGGDEVSTGSNITIVGRGYYCAAVVTVPTDPAIVLAQGNGESMFVTNSGIFTSVPIGTRMLSRLVTSDAIGALSVRCRIDHGVALGVVAIPDSVPPPEISAGYPGVVVYEHTAELLGIAIYRFTPNASCAPADVR